jgi:hypothetical protein
MEMKMGNSTVEDARRASMAHYDVENQIMDHVKAMTLAGKRKLAENMGQHAQDDEKSAKS